MYIYFFLMRTSEYIQAHMYVYVHSYIKLSAGARSHIYKQVQQRWFAAALVFFHNVSNYCPISTPQDQPKTLFRAPHLWLYTFLFTNHEHDSLNNDMVSLLEKAIFLLNVLYRQLHVCINIYIYTYLFVFIYLSIYLCI